MTSSSQRWAASSIHYISITAKRALHEPGSRIPALHAMADRAVYASPRRIGLWRARGPGGLHAQGPGGRPEMDHPGRLQGGTRAGPDGARPARSATGYL